MVTISMSSMTLETSINLATCSLSFWSQPKPNDPKYNIVVNKTFTITRCKSFIELSKCKFSINTYKSTCVLFLFGSFPQTLSGLLRAWLWSNPVWLSQRAASCSRGVRPWTKGGFHRFKPQNFANMWNSNWKIISYYKLDDICDGMIFVFIYWYPINDDIKSLNRNTLGYGYIYIYHICIYHPSWIGMSSLAKSSRLLDQDPILGFKRWD